MIKRIYVDNYKCLVNFDLPFDNMNLLLGQNGSGKSSAFEVISLLRKFVVEQRKTNDLFLVESLTRWQEQNIQRFEIEIEGNSGIYTYKLTIDHDLSHSQNRVQKEVLLFGKHLLFKFENGTAQLYHDDFKQGPEYPFDWTQSGIGFLHSRPDNKKLTWFRNRLSRIVVAQINPFAMEAECEKENDILDDRMTNFSAWYRYLSQEKQNTVFDLTIKLREILEGFQSLSLSKFGEKHKVLKLLFRADQRSDETCYSFNELSDGQRVLIALYTLLYAYRGEGWTFCIDEPDNFVALREIQPWLMELQDECLNGKGQVLLISHHPELIDYLASSSGIWFNRDLDTSVRFHTIAEAKEKGLNLSEIIARGWESE